MERNLEALRLVPDRLEDSQAASAAFVKLLSMLDA